MRLGERLCFALCNQIFERRARALGRYFASNQDYAAQDRSREAEAQRYLSHFRRTVDFQGKVILDYACGSGAVAYTIAKITRPQEMIGLDANQESVARGLAAFSDITLRHIPKDRTDLPDASVDVAYTTDAFEHFERPDMVLTELYRVVKPGGYLLIHFIPWWGLEGAHLEGVIPIPWCHVLFSERTLFRTARRVVRSGFYKPLAWDFDAQGRRRYDLYDGRDGFDPAYLNRITIRRFKRYVAEFTRAQRLELVELSLDGFSGKTYPLARWLAWLRHLPGLNELANRGVYCALRKCR